MSAEKTKQFHGICVCVPMEMCVRMWLMQEATISVFIILFPASVFIDHTEAGVSQSPSYKVTKKGQNVTFRCDPVSGHTVLYWYQKNPEQSPKFLMYFRDELPSDTSGMPPERFSAERTEGTFSHLKIQSAQPGDSAVYLCASSHSEPRPPPSCSQTSFSPVNY